MVTENMTAIVRQTEAGLLDISPVLPQSMESLTSFNDQKRMSQSFQGYVICEFENKAQLTTLQGEFCFRFLG